MANIWLVSGERGSGKTTLCAAVVRRMRAAGWDVAGLLSPAVLGDGRKLGIDVLDLRSGARRRLANARVTEEVPDGIHTRAWAFDSEALEWGDRVLQSAVPCDLLVVDELGMLEFERSQGWVSGLAVLDERRYRHALAVVRPELLEPAQQRWPDAQVVTVQQVIEQQAQKLADQLLSNPGE